MVTHNYAARVPEAGSKSLKPGFWPSWEDKLHATSAARMERTWQREAERFLCVSNVEWLPAKTVYLALKSVAYRSVAGRLRFTDVLEQVVPAKRLR